MWFHILFNKRAVFRQNREVCSVVRWLCFLKIKGGGLFNSLFGTLGIAPTSRLRDLTGHTHLKHAIT